MMKKFALILVCLAIGVVACGQEVLKRDLELRKTAPVLNLNGSGAVLQFYNGDVSLTQSTNTLTLSGGDLALGANNLTMTGSIGATGARITKGWFTDLESTNAIAGSITGNAATVTGFTRNAGSLTLSGGHGVTATTTGTTAVTLPTSGTLRSSTTYQLDNLIVSGTTVYGIEGSDSTLFYTPVAMRDDASTIFPTIQSAAGDTSNYATPDKIGDLYIDTSAGKVYVSVSASRGGWRILNYILPLFFVMSFKRRRRK